MTHKNNEEGLHAFLAMCTLFDEVRDKCLTATRTMIAVCDHMGEEVDSEKDSSVDLARLAEKRGQMISFLESLQIRILETASGPWETTREEAISKQRLDHFNRGVIQWSLEMENLESALQSRLNKVRSDTKHQLSDTFKRGQLHKGYNLNDVR